MALGGGISRLRSHPIDSGAVTAPADLIFPCPDPETLREVGSWDGFRPAAIPVSDFPVDVVRFDGSASRPVVISRAKRAETLKAMPASLRARAEAAFARLAAPPPRLRMARGRALDFAGGPAVMGILNVTPDSFSDGGLHFERDLAVARALQMFEEGAAIVDVGGESTRPANYGEARPLPSEEEISRVVPVIEGIRAKTDAPLSIDTRKADVARAALGAGVDMVNDVSAGRYDDGMFGTIAAAGAGAILMHMKGIDPRTMQDDLRYGHLVGEIAAFLADAARRAEESGVAEEAIAIDPGLGFGKSPEDNLALLRHLAAFRTLGRPVAAGASRKGFVRRFSGVSEKSSPAERLPGSLAALAAAAAAGAAILRVHDVAESVRFLRMTGAIARTAPTAGQSSSPSHRSPAGSAAR
jgi:dihydropteroate synthase